MSNVDEKQIETIRNLVNDMDKKVDQLLEISEDSLRPRKMLNS